jgi:hypothetical protein
MVLQQGVEESVDQLWLPYRCIRRHGKICVEQFLSQHYLWTGIDASSSKSSFSRYRLLELTQLLLELLLRVSMSRQLGCRGILLTFHNDCFNIDEPSRVPWYSTNGAGFAAVLYLIVRFRLGCFRRFHTLSSLDVFLAQLSGLSIRRLS